MFNGIFGCQMFSCFNPNSLPNHGSAMFNPWRDDWWDDLPSQRRNIYDLRNYNVPKHGDVVK